MRDITMAIEEISLSGGISLGECSLRTLYRWRNAINWRLTKGNYDWRVRVNKKSMCLEMAEN